MITVKQLLARQPKPRRHYQVLYDRLYEQEAVIEQVIGNVFYVIYRNPIPGTITITGSQFRAYSRDFIVKGFTNGRFMWDKSTTELPELPEDSRLHNER